MLRFCSEKSCCAKKRTLVNFTYILRAAFALYFAKTLQSQSVRKKWRKELSYEKGPHKMLMKLTPVVDFTNILQATFLLFQKKL